MGTLESFLTVAEWKPLPLFRCNCTKQTNIQSNTKKLAETAPSQPQSGICANCWKKSVCGPSSERCSPSALWQRITSAVLCNWTTSNLLLSVIYSILFFFYPPLLFLHGKKIEKFRAYLFLVLVGRCLRKVVGLAASVLGEFREGTQPPCSGAQTHLARQSCSTHVHAQMNARWEVGWGLGVGVVASIVPTGSVQYRALASHTHSHTQRHIHTAVVLQCAALSLTDKIRSAILFIFLLWIVASPACVHFCISSLTDWWNSCNKACQTVVVFGHARALQASFVFGLSCSSLLPQQMQECSRCIVSAESSRPLNIQTSCSHYTCM